MLSFDYSPVASVVIPVFNKWELTKACLESLAQHTPAGMVEVIVVDNGSTDETRQALAPLGQQLFGSLFVRIRWEENRNFGPACNAGAAAARAPMLFFLNNDTLLTPNWLPPLLEAFEADPRLGAVGPLLLYENGTVQHLGVTFTLGSVHHLYAGYPITHRVVSRKRKLQVITAAALMVPKALFQACNGFFPEYRNGFEDVELSLRIRQQGFTLGVNPSSRIFHLESQSTGRKANEDKNAQLLKARCCELFYPDEHFHAIQDGFVLELDSLYSLRYRVGPEESAQLFASLQKKNPIDLLDFVDANPSWLEGHIFLAKQMEASKAVPEAIFFWYKASHIMHNEFIIYNMARLLLNMPEMDELKKEMALKMTQLKELRAKPTLAMRLCKQKIEAAKEFQDTTMEALYQNALDKLAEKKGQA